MEGHFSRLRLIKRQTYGLPGFPTCNNASSRLPNRYARVRKNVQALAPGEKYNACLGTTSTATYTTDGQCPRDCRTAEGAFPPGGVAIGLYGSLAREEDGPFSDIEMFGVLQANQYEQRYEWCTAAWKAEVDIYGKQTLREQAARVDGRWPLTHSAFQTVLPLYDPEHFFAEICTIAQASPEPLFRAAIENLLVDDVFVHRSYSFVAFRHSYDE